MKPLVGSVDRNANFEDAKASHAGDKLLQPFILEPEIRRLATPIPSSSFTPPSSIRTGSDVSQNLPSRPGCCSGWGKGSPHIALQRLTPTTIRLVPGLLAGAAAYQAYRDRCRYPEYYGPHDLPDECSAKPLSCGGSFPGRRLRRNPDDHWVGIRRVYSPVRCLSLKKLPT